MSFFYNPILGNWFFDGLKKFLDWIVGIGAQAINGIIAFFLWTPFKAEDLLPANEDSWLIDAYIFANIFININAIIVAVFFILKVLVIWWIVKMIWNLIP
jgi:hypothetical protein